jgi:glucokinase
VGTVLAGDVGATKTNLALFNGVRADDPVASATYDSQEHGGLSEMVRDFLDEHPADVQAACFGVAGRVHGHAVDTTNLAWPVDGERLAALLHVPHVRLLNDVEANAWGIAALAPDDFAVLNEGDAGARGNAAVISAGTGLGQAGLYWDGQRHHPFATEGGHADFAPEGELGLELYRFLASDLEHVSYERVCSGLGIVNLYRFFLQRNGVTEPEWFTAARDRGAGIASAADAGDASAASALDLFCSIYGAQAGNLALTMMATGGVYVGGGIAPKLLPRLQSGGFVRAFVDKGRFRSVLAAIPVKVILNDRAALLGAALCASS